jgi:proliferating cell nuclear antigen
MFDDPGADVAQIVTDGATIKPFLTALSVVDYEVKLQVTERGIGTTIVDPANVFAADVFLNADEFETYDVERETTLGVSVQDLQSLVRRARKGQDDELTLSLRQREITATVARGYDNHEVVSNGTMDLIDPDSIRQEPKMPDVDCDVSVGIDTAAFKDALSYAVGEKEYLEFAVKGVNQHTNALYLGGETDTREESVAIDGIDADRCEGSLYSKDYLKNILKGITAIDPDAVGLTFDVELPATFTATSGGLSVEYLLAPRIHKDD